MINQELVKYIQQQLQEGVDKEEIKRVLITQGWQEVDINEGFSEQGGNVSDGVNPAKPEIADNAVITETADPILSKKPINIRPRRSKQLITIVALVVVLILATGVGAWYYLRPQKSLYEQTVEQIEDLTSEEGQFENDMLKSFITENLIRGLNHIVTGLFVFVETNKIYPKKLKELDSLPPEIKQSIEEGIINYMYAYSSDGQCYHIGVKLEESNSVLEHDTDLDSVAEGYINGFSGADPVYDMVSCEGVKNILKEINETPIPISNVNLLKNIQEALELEFIENRQFPIRLDEVSVNDDTTQAIKDGGFLYTYSYDRKYYHIGVLVETDSIVLNNDDDFNSLEHRDIWLAEKFDGTDPIYDLVSDNYRQLLEDQVRSGDIFSLDSALQMYHDFNGNYPKNLEKLIEYLIEAGLIRMLSEGILERAETNNYMYAVSKDNNEFHLGGVVDPDINEISKDRLNNDDDFNSIEAGFENGFDGADPVYDIHGGM